MTHRTAGAVISAEDITPSSAMDAIVIAGGGNLDWDDSLPTTVASWTQEAGCRDTVTVHTVYGAVGFSNLTAYKPGIYTAAELGAAVADRSGGDGRVIVLGTGTLIRMR